MNMVHSHIVGPFFILAVRCPVLSLQSQCFADWLFLIRPFGPAAAHPIATSLLSNGDSYDKLSLFLLYMVGDTVWTLISFPSLAGADWQWARRLGATQPVGIMYGPRVFGPESIPTGDISSFIWPSTGLHSHLFCYLAGPQGC